MNPGICDNMNPGICDNMNPGICDNMNPGICDNMNPGIFDKMNPGKCDNMNPGICDNMNPGICDNMDPGKCDNINPGICDNMNPEICDNMNPEICDNMNPEICDNMNPGICDNMNPGICDNMNPGICDNMNPGKCDNMNPGICDNMNPGILKYIKEMSAFFKNTSPGAPWDSPHATPQKGADAPPAELKEARTIPLKMCQVTRKQCPPDTENRYFEVISSSRKNSVFLRAKDPAMAQSWYNAIQAGASALVPQVRGELRAMQAGLEVKHMGWITEQRDLLLYPTLPDSKDSINSPAKSHPLITTRLVHSGPGKSSPLLDSELSFGLRTGTKQGVETHLFRVDSAKELSAWTHMLVDGCHNAAELIQEVTTVHIDEGFSLFTEEMGIRKTVLLQQPFERLRMSSDDGVHMIFLDFGGPEAEIQLDLHSCPKTMVFIIHSFLSAKVKRLGLLA
ncbi:unnamed protein product [Coregonus sp. 'balchen']|nr:unnamed protein product [Coregonus sp. 'balchen']